MKGVVVLARLGVGETRGALGGDQLHLLRGTVQGDVVDAEVPVVVGLCCSVEAGGEEGGLCASGGGDDVLVQEASVAHGALQIVCGSTVVGKSPPETFDRAEEEEEGGKS